MGAELGKRHVQGFQAGLHNVVNCLIDLVFIKRLRTVDEDLVQSPGGHNANGTLGGGDCRAVVAAVHDTPYWFVHHVFPHKG